MKPCLIFSSRGGDFIHKKPYICKLVYSSFVPADMKTRVIFIMAVMTCLAQLLYASESEPVVFGHASDSSVREEFAIYYKHDSITINPTYLQNRRQIDRIITYLKDSPRIDSITIYAWASPEGGYSHNVWLSQERAKAARRFLLQHTPDSSKLSADKIKISPLAENWPGLIKKVEENYFRHDRQRVLDILYADNIGDETRKWRLKQLDKGYTWTYLIRRYMPELRAATWVCVWAEVLPPLPDVAEVVDEPVAQEKPLVRAPGVPPQLKRTIVGLKTNLAYDAASVLNFAVEVPFNEHFSILYEHHCPWWLWGDNKYCIQFLSYGGEFRWWFSPKTRPETQDLKLRDALVGHFLGLNVWGGKSDIQWKRAFGCYQFDFISAGLTYGYSLPISKWLNMEFSISAGYARIPYQHYIPTEDWQILLRDKNDAGVLHYFGPTKVEVSLVIPIRVKIGGFGK